MHGTVLLSEINRVKVGLVPLQDSLNEQRFKKKKMRSLFYENLNRNEIQTKNATGSGW